MKTSKKMLEILAEAEKQKPWKTLVVKIDFQPPNDEAEKSFVDHAIKEMKPGQIADYTYEVVKSKKKLSESTIIEEGIDDERFKFAYDMITKRLGLSPKIVKKQNDNYAIEFRTPTNVLIGSTSIRLDSSMGDLIFGESYGLFMQSEVREICDEIVKLYRAKFEPGKSSMKGVEGGYRRALRKENINEAKLTDEKGKLTLSFGSDRSGFLDFLKLVTYRSIGSSQVGTVSVEVNKEDNSVSFQ